MLWISFFGVKIKIIANPLEAQVNDFAKMQLIRNHTSSSKTGICSSVLAKMCMEL